MADTSVVETLGIVLVSGAHDRVHAGFLLAAGAAALGRSVVMFATGAGVRALCTDWSGLAGAADDARLRARGVAGLGELREAVRDLGAELIACSSGLLGEAIEPAELMAGVTCAGMASFLATTRGAQLICL